MLYFAIFVKNSTIENNRRSNDIIGINPFFWIIPGALCKARQSCRRAKR